MKKLLLILTIATMAIACNSEKKYQSVDTKEFSQIISSNNIQLVDARTPAEFAEGHIPGAQNIDVKNDDFDSQILTLDKTRPVAVYCRSGRRSKQAAERLSDAGYKVIELNKGILSWNGDIQK